MCLQISIFTLFKFQGFMSEKNFIMCVVAIISIHKIKCKIFLIAEKICNRWKELWIEKRKKSISKSALWIFFFSWEIHKYTHIHSRKKCFSLEQKAQREHNKKQKKNYPFPIFVPFYSRIFISGELNAIL